MKNIPPQLASQEETAESKFNEFVFQFICHETGHRSEPFLSTWTKLGEILELRTPEQEKPSDKDYILLVAVMDGKQTHIPTSPLITVETYLNNVKPEK